MGSLIVHGRATSSNVQAVMWGMAEMGLTPERRDVGGRHGGNYAPSFRAISPMGLVPALQDGSLSLFESAAILRYLAQRYGNGTLLPGAPEPRARVDQWAEWGKHTFCNAFTMPIFWAHYRTPEDERDTDAVAASVEVFESLMDVFKERVAAHDFVAGDTLTLADIWIGHVLYRYFTLDIRRNAPPEVTDYFNRLRERPAYKEHVMVDYSELKGVKRQ
jgi:glutathione S-transferase